MLFSLNSCILIKVKKNISPLEILGCRSASLKIYQISFNFLSYMRLLILKPLIIVMERNRFIKNSIDPNFFILFSCKKSLDFCTNSVLISNLIILLVPSTKL